MPYQEPPSAPYKSNGGDLRNRGSDQAVRLIVVAGVQLYREGLASILDRCPEVKLVGTASTIEEILGLLDTRSPEVVVLDMGTTGSHAIVRGIRDAAPNVDVVAYAVEESEQHILACARSKVSAFIPQQGSERDLIEVIRALARDELPCSGRTAAILYNQLQHLASRAADGPDLGRLTIREREVLNCIDHGQTNKEIALELCIEVATVKNHVHKILDKLQVSSRARAAAMLRHSA